MAKEELVYQGIPLWLLREYLEEIGGQAESDDRVIGDGWSVTLSKIEPFRIGSLAVGRVKMELNGDPDAINRMRPDLDRKTLRAGG